MQIGRDGIHRAICYAAPRSCLQSAVFGEMIGVDATALVLSRGALEDGQPHEAGAMETGIDCSAVVGAFGRFCRGQALGRFPFAGSFRHAALSAIGVCRKVRAHVWEGDAMSEGWNAEWKGNDLADHYAKLARLPMDRDPEPWLEDQRSRRRLLQRLLAKFSPDAVWADMRRLRPAAGRCKALQDRAADAMGHQPVFVGGSWLCKACGTA